MKEFNFPDYKYNNGLFMTDPVSYFDFLSLEMNSRFVLTDSGGVQEETTFFKVPCITIRENTERPITVTEGTNVIVGTDSDRILQESKAIINGNGKIGGVPKFWDDGVSGRIVEVVGKLIKVIS